MLGAKGVGMYCGYAGIMYGGLGGQYVSPRRTVPTGSAAIAQPLINKTAAGHRSAAANFASRIPSILCPPMPTNRRNQTSAPLACPSGHNGNLCGLLRRVRLYWHRSQNRHSLTQNAASRLKLSSNRSRPRPGCGSARPKGSEGEFGIRRRGVDQSAAAPSADCHPRAVQRLKLGNLVTRSVSKGRIAHSRSLPRLRFGLPLSLSRSVLSKVKL